jgi:steroid delta-isomerase-like uncharacterized protein
MTDRTNIDIIESSFEGWNAHDFDKIAAHVSSDYVFETDALPSPVQGRDAFIDFARAYLTAFPDLHFTLTDVFASEDRVVVTWSASGTHLGELRGLAPTGRPMHVDGCTIARFRDGKLTRQRAFWDSAAIFRQLGAEAVGGEREPAAGE